jgi:hypothetical protein
MPQGVAAGLEGTKTSGLWVSGVAPRREVGASICHEPFSLKVGEDRHMRGTPHLHPQFPNLQRPCWLKVPRFFRKFQHQPHEGERPMHIAGAKGYRNGFDGSAAPAYERLSRGFGEHPPRSIATTRALQQGTRENPPAFSQHRAGVGGDQSEASGAGGVHSRSPLEHVFPEAGFRRGYDHRLAKTSGRSRRAITWIGWQTRRHINHYNLAISALFVFLVAWNLTDRLTAKPSSLHQPTSVAKSDKRAPMVIVVRER